MEKLRAPERFNLDAHDLVDAWKKWKEELNLYIDLVMDSEDEQAKVKLFLYLVGTRGREIYLTMAFDQEPQNRTLGMVLQAFDGYCNPKRNETVERYRFNMRNQNREETFDKYVTELKILATTCNYGALQDSLIRDKIICGIQDSHVRERLLRVIDLDLPKCLQISRAAELSKERIKTLENPTFSDLEMHGVKHKEILIINSKSNIHIKLNYLMHKLHLLVNIAEENTNSTRQNVPLLVRSVGNVNNDKFKAEFVVVKDGTLTPWLGSKAVQAMNLVTVNYENIKAVRQGALTKPLSKEIVMKEYADIFEGTGKLEGKYHLELDNTANPVVHPPRKVPVAIKEKLHSELERLTKLEIIKPVSTPTPWVSSLVTVVKPDKLRICIDPKHLNQ
ncbi:unnamed protein product [Mytilus coruscus]|uniref:Retrotransposon gag domain-containing protein n=1 Tax=Mytilus coruscus TaxID=42192 RepID=A0A6J8CHT1_MYTCO|nr:unnamed protein product [Mytilus coruscus]